jgi:hypothetical protein
MSQPALPPPTAWDSLKYTIAASLMIAYLPVFLIASAYFGATGGVMAFLGVTLGIVVLRCSDCSMSLFNHGRLWKPWPWRACPHCARPLVRVANSDEGLNQSDAQAPSNTSLERTRER